MTESASPETGDQPKEKPIFHVCVASDNSYIVKRQKTEGEPPKSLFVPWLNAADPRMFVRNGELIKPYGVVAFGFQRMVYLSDVAHDMAIYREVARTDFDPSDCVPIQYFDIEKLAESLNTPNTAEIAA
jgi:hypothetical protein